jgi:hypothetical protein
MCTYFAQKPAKQKQSTGQQEHYVSF